MADGNWLTAEELGPGPACGSVLRCFQRSSCTRCTTSSESSESRLCDRRTGSASPACDGHTKGRVAHPPAGTLRTVSQGHSKETPAVPGATCCPPNAHPPASVHTPPSALRPHDAPGRQHAPIDTVAVPGNSGGYLDSCESIHTSRLFFSPTPTNRTGPPPPARGKPSDGLPQVFDIVPPVSQSAGRASPCLASVGFDRRRHRPEPPYPRTSVSPTTCPPHRERRTTGAFPSSPRRISIGRPGPDARLG